MIRNNFLKSKLEKGISTVGTWQTIPSSIVTDIICSAGLDFVIVDAEHGPISFETAQEMAIACQSRDCLLYTSPSPRDLSTSRMPSSA